jgi:hypothetical protein
VIDVERPWVSVERLSAVRSRFGVVFGEDFLDDARILEELMLRIAPLGAAAAVFRLFDDVEERVFLQEITDASQ